MRILQYIKKLKSAKNTLKKQRLYALLFTLTLCLVLSTSAAPSYSQTPTPTPRPEIEEIRKLAKSDVENDIPRRNDYAVKLYSKKFPKLKDYEILQTYDDEYTKQNDNKKSSLLKQLPSTNEWVAAVILFLLFTFNDFVKEYITNFFKNIVNLFYNLLSGTTLFNIISLQEYRNELIKKYQQSSIPYLPQRPLDLHKVYVPLEVELTPDNRNDAVNTLKEHRRLILTGESGSGKSMLLKYIAFSYAKGHFKNTDANSKNNDNWNDVFSDRPIPVLLELRRLNDSDKTLQQHFVDALDRDGFSNGQRFVEHNLQQGKLMLLLDGLDEVNSNIIWRVIRDINNLLDKNQECRVIITCRTAFYKDEFTTILTSNFGVINILKIANFNEQQIRGFLRLWEQDMPPGKSINELEKTFQKESRIHDLAQRPLILAIIAYLYTYNDLTLFHSSTEFYRRATDILLNQWYSEGNQFLLEDKKRILQKLALFYQIQQESPYRLDYQKVLKYLRDVIRKLDIDVEPNQAKSLLEEIINRSGLMMATDNGTIYQFVHRSFQEFFVAEALQEKEEIKQENKFILVPNELQEKNTQNEKYLIEKFNGYKEQDRWQEIVRFWCGLAENPTYVIEKVYEKNKISALELLTEIQNIHTDIAVIAKKIIDEFKIWIFKKTDINNDEINRISRAFSSLAVSKAFSTKSNVNEIFNFFRDVVQNQITNIDDYEIAVNILSMTYTAEAANILISQYTQREQNAELRQILDQALIGMGDIAVPEIEKIVTNDSVNILETVKIVRTETVPKIQENDSVNQVMDTLVGIGTPNALKVLVNLLWNKDENKALRAALLLASLIKKENHKIILNGFKEVQKYSRQDSYDWLVKPYRAEQNLHIILLQIVYCISKKLKDSVEIIDQLYIQDFDQNLIIPICFIQALALENSSFLNSLNNPENTNFIKQENYENYINNFCQYNESTIWELLIYNIYPVNFVLLKTINLKLYKTVNKLKREWQNRGRQDLPKAIKRFFIQKKIQFFSFFKRRKNITMPASIKSPIENSFNHDFSQFIPENRGYFDINKAKVIRKLITIIKNIQKKMKPGTGAVSSVSTYSASDSDSHSFYSRSHSFNGKFSEYEEISYDGKKYIKFSYGKTLEFYESETGMNFMNKKIDLEDILEEWDLLSEKEKEVLAKKYQKEWEGKIIINKKLAPPLKSKFFNHVQHHD